MADKAKNEPQVERREFSDEERSSEGAPIATTRPRTVDPAADVSNADIDIQAVSLDSGHSSYVENPEPNPDELRPAPGPSSIQVLGVPTDDPVENKFEETR